MTIIVSSEALVCVFDATLIKKWVVCGAFLILKPSWLLLYIIVKSNMPSSSGASRIQSQRAVSSSKVRSKHTLYWTLWGNGCTKVMLWFWNHLGLNLVFNNLNNKWSLVVLYTEQRIKYFQIILNSNFLLLSSQNWNCSKSWQLATLSCQLETLIKICSILAGQIWLFNWNVANWQLKSRQLATFWAISILARQKLKIAI